MEQNNNHIDDRVNTLDSSVNSIDTELNNFIIDQLKFIEVTEKKISDLTESAARIFLENDTNERHVKTDVLNIQESVQNNIRKSEILSELTESLN